ncbi:MAG: bifunctional demethylmenaquinone methyltransferase/2-methoxy-6-polyprenyl-1,4-benzoquinol methylase UbiE [Mastigocoleus sp.]|mgnify:CR=1 FL=1
MSDEIRSIFNRIAPVYDQLNDWLSLGQHRVWKEMTVKWSQAKLGDICLDLCCGSGDLTFRLWQHVKENQGKVRGENQLENQGKVYGVDFSPELLEVAQKRSQQHYPVPEISWIEADVLNLPFEDNTFDAGTMGYGLRNVTNISRSLQEIHRVLKPGARAAILDFHRPQSSWMRVFQEWYLDNLVVPMAQRMELKEEYAYISPSLDRFPTGTQQVELSLQAGFPQATHYPIANGMMGVLVVEKL